MPPNQVDINAYGWFSLGADLQNRKAAGQNRARLEVGHSYVLALRWLPAGCGEDGCLSARWTVIGSGGAIPADGGIIGQGELEGSIASPDENVTKLSWVGDSELPLLVDFAGQEVLSLVEALTTATPYSVEGDGGW